MSTCHEADDKHKNLNKKCRIGALQKRKTKMKYLLIMAAIFLTSMQSGCSLYQKIFTQKSPAVAPREATPKASSTVSHSLSECQAISHDIDRAAKRLNELELLSNSKQCH